MDIESKYNYWLTSDIIDDAYKEELKAIQDKKEIEDRFFKDLTFGTGGIRGVIGAGSNRMNIYTVRRAVQGLAEYLISKYKINLSVAIAYDSRNKSKEFAKAAALTLCGNGIKVYLFSNLRPTPMLSYAVRRLECLAGIVITASHNPREYNGCKVYGKDGGQITDACAKEIFECIEGIDAFEGIASIEENEAIKNQLLIYIDKEIDDQYINLVKELTIRKHLVSACSKDLKIIYTPLHGTGAMPIKKVLEELGYESLFIVKEQEEPDEYFTTVKYPNPEDPKAFTVALAMAKAVEPDIILATDPDCDRVGVVTKNERGNLIFLSGNEIGILLSDYIINALKEANKLPDNGVIIKTIVTTEGVRELCLENNIKLYEVLTGFKYIGELIGEIERRKNEVFLFGFEESFGYLMGSFVRDKDAIIAAVLICEMALYYKNIGKTLYEGLNAIFQKYGYFKEELIAIELQGKEGQEKIEFCIDGFRNSNLVSIAGKKISYKFDYKSSIKYDYVENRKEIINLPVSNVLKYTLQDGSWFVIRPSGTEPKVKIYLGVKADSREEAERSIAFLRSHIETLIDAMLN